MTYDCSSRERRAAMNDDEFWQDVAEPVAGIEPEPDQMDIVALFADPCPECGETGACAVDDYGRAMVHVISEDDR